MSHYWLMKAEPDSRIVKGKDVKFSVDDFESIGTTPWEGVRNHEAKNLMQSMELGDKVLFYHSNCKNPGIAGFAEVVKKAYPDDTAWDPDHPYYDDKTDKENPRWFMVDVKFVSRARNFIPLALLRHIADSPEQSPPSCLDYIGDHGVKVIKDMALVRRGRLSVQKVSEVAWQTMHLLADKGGWDEIPLGKGKSASSASKKSKPQRRKKKKEEDDGTQEDTDAEAGMNQSQSTATMEDSQSSLSSRKRKAGGNLERTDTLPHNVSSLSARRSSRMRI